MERKEISTLNYPSWLRGVILCYFYLRTIKKRTVERKRLLEIENSINTIVIVLEGISSVEDNKDKIRILDISLFTLTIEYDISTLSYLMTFQMDKWKQRCVGRQLAVILYESTNDLLELLGKDFRKMLKSSQNTEDLILELNHITSELSSFKKNNKEILSEIRNYCGAHRDKNAYEQLRVINSIEMNDILELCRQFMQPVSQLTQYFTKVMASMNRV